MQSSVTDVGVSFCPRISVQKMATPALEISNCENHFEKNCNLYFIKETCMTN